MISHHHQTIFVHIPKTAGKSITKLFKDAIITYKHPAPHQEELYQKHWTKYYTFTCIRNPFDRFVSWYFFMRKRYKEGNTQLAPQLATKYNFSDFIHNILELEKPCLETIKPLSHWFSKGYSYDYIIRYENLSTDIEYIQKKMSLPNIQCINKTERKPYREYYDKSTIKKMSEYYKKDLERFNYEY